MPISITTAAETPCGTRTPCAGSWGRADGSTPGGPPGRCVLWQSGGMDRAPQMHEWTLRHQASLSASASSGWPTGSRTSSTPSACSWRSAGSSCPRPSPTRATAPPSGSASWAGSCSPSKPAPGSRAEHAALNGNQNVRGWRAFTSVPVQFTDVEDHHRRTCVTHVKADRGGLIDTVVDVQLSPGLAHGHPPGRRDRACGGPDPGDRRRTQLRHRVRH